MTNPIIQHFKNGNLIRDFISQTIPDPKLIGIGSQGIAFEYPNFGKPRILKLTTSDAELEAARLILKHQPPGFAEYHQTQTVVHDGLPIHLIGMEKLEPITGEEEEIGILMSVLVRECRTHFTDENLRSFYKWMISDVEYLEIPETKTFGSGIRKSDFLTWDRGPEWTPETSISIWKGFGSGRFVSFSKSIIRVFESAERFKIPDRDIHSRNMGYNNLNELSAFDAM